MRKLVRHPGWRSLSDLQESINELFEPGLRFPVSGSEESLVDWAPSIDIEDKKKEYLVTADLPGVDPKNTKIKVENGVLIIRGEKETKQEESSKEYIRVERTKGTFERRLALPDSVDADNISAKSEHGTLKIVIPKRTTSEGGAREIKIDF